MSNCRECGATIEARVVGSLVLHSEVGAPAVHVCAEHVPLVSAKLARDPAACLQRAESLRALADKHGAGALLLHPRRPS